MFDQTGVFDVDKNLNWEIVKKLLKNFIYSVAKLYLILVVILWGFFLFNVKDSIICVFVIFCIITIGVLLDNRFNRLRKVVLLLVNIIQIIIWYYFEILPILLLKDIFLFSVILNCAFIWHVLILPWLFEVCRLLKWDYGCFLITRISILTSLSGILLVIKVIHLLIWRIKVYYLYINTNFCVNSDRKQVWIKCIFNLLLMLKIVYLILNYFIKLFNNYSKLLLAKNQKIKLLELLKNSKYLSFLIITFLLSWTILVPRIYIVWVSIFIWNWLYYVVISNSLSLEKGVIKFIINLFLNILNINNVFISADLESYDIIKEWKLIYNLDYYADYLRFFEGVFFVAQDWDADAWFYLDYFEVMEFFIFDSKWRLKFIAKILLLNSRDRSYEDYEDVLDFLCTEYSVEKEGLCKVIRVDIGKQVITYAWYPAKDNNITLFDYLILYNARYFVNNIIIKSNQYL